MGKVKEVAGKPGWVEGGTADSSASAKQSRF